MGVGCVVGKGTRVTGARLKVKVLKLSGRNKNLVGEKLA